MGIMDKFKNAFGAKKEMPEEPVRRIPVREAEPQVPLEDQAGERWRAAKKWREDREIDTPIMKRRKF